MRPLLKGRGPHAVRRGEGIHYFPVIFGGYLLKNPSTVRTATVPLPLDKGGNKKIPSFEKTKDGIKFTRGTTFFGAKSARLESVIRRCRPVVLLRKTQFPPAARKWVHRFFHCRIAPKLRLSLNEKTNYLFFVKAFKIFKHIRFIISIIQRLCQGIFYFSSSKLISSIFASLQRRSRE